MEPKTLKQAIEYFSDPQRCHDYVVANCWPDGVVCPRCGSKNVKFSAKFNRWQCGSHHERRQFTLKTGTVFEESPIGLDKWLTAMWLLVNSKNGISSWEVSRSIGVTQKSAWFMMHRLRSVLQPQNDGTKLGGNEGGEVEVDETFVGGKVGNMHRAKRIRYVKEKGGTGGYSGKTVVQGMLDRNLRQVRAQVVPDTKRETLQNEVLKNVKYGSRVYSDNAVGYDKLHSRYIHDVVNHIDCYVKGRVHTNGLENFWSLLKRGLKGTYVAVEPFHLDRYVDEQAFRYNNRATKDNPLDDADRFVLALSQVTGRRLMYKELTGKGQEEAF